MILSSVPAAESRCLWWRHQLATFDVMINGIKYIVDRSSLRSLSVRPRHVELVNQMASEWLMRMTWGVDAAAYEWYLVGLSGTSRSTIKPTLQYMKKTLTCPDEGLPSHWKGWRMRYEMVALKMLNKLISLAHSFLAYFQTTGRRFVVGLHEVPKQLRMKHLQCVIIAPNIERIQSKGLLF